MKARRVAIGAAGVVCLLFLIVFFSLLFIPSNLLEDIAVRQLAAQGYVFKTTSFRKAFPLGIKAEGVELRNRNKELVLKADRVTVRARILPLFVGRMIVAWKMQVAGGAGAGEFNIRSGAWHVDVRGVKLEEVPFFASVAGVGAKGELHATGNYSGGKRGDGELKLEVRGLDLKSVRISGIPLPDAGYDKVQGMISIKGGSATIKTLNLQGEALFARLKGQMQLVKPVNVSPLDLTLELMPKPQFLEEQKVVFLLLVKYQDSPGHYQIPLHGTLGHPAIQ